MKTDATSHNIVKPTMMGVVGTCCVVHANTVANCHYSWRSSKETMHYGKVISYPLFLVNFAIHMRKRFRHKANIVMVPYAHGLRFADHRKIEMLGLVAPKD